MAARLPIDLGGLDSFCDPSVATPLSRWSLEPTAASKARFGNWMSGIEDFDGSFFGISLPEAEIMDPQQRLLLELAYEASQVSSITEGTREAC